MHLLKAGVNVIYIRDLLGHADVSTTEIYARADPETKRKAIENAYESLTPEPLPSWTADRDLLEWLDHDLPITARIMWPEPAPATGPARETPQPAT